MSKKINLIFLITLILYSLYCAMQLGYTWDVLFYYDVGKERLDYLLSLGLNEVDTKIYARRFLTGAYSTISAFFVQIFPKKYILESIYIFNLSFSILAIFGIYNVTKELFNKEIGQIVFLICFFNPIFFGHMAMNSIDTIIAFSNIWFFYVILKYLKHQQNEKKRKKYIICSGLLLGLGLGVRYSFLITVVPILFFALFEIFYFKLIINKNFMKKNFIKDSIKVLLIGYFFMVLFWPHTHQNIILQPFKLALESFLFGFGTPAVLFNGEIFHPSELPKSYILVNLFYKMPEFVILSFVIFFILFFKISLHFRNKFKGYNFKILTILLIILFPNLLILASPYSAYDGLRLFLFLIPYICIVPAVLIFFLYKNLQNKLYKFTFIFIFFFKVFFLFNFFAMTPYQYVYINIFGGKHINNSERFENDYWGVSTKKLISYIENNKSIFNKSKVKFAVCGIPDDVQIFYLKKIKNLDFKIVDINEEFDFVIMNNRVVWDKKNYTKTSKNAQTCFQKYSGEDIIKVQRRGLILSKITKI